MEVNTVRLNGEYSIQDLEVIIAEYKAKDKVLVTIEWEETRNNKGIKEQIVVNINDWDILQDYIVCNIDVYFGEINGKHSEVYGTINEDEITVSDNKDDITIFLKKHPSGHNYNHSFLLTIYQQYVDGEDDWYEQFGEDNILKLIKVLP
jgi:hypothetical protein